MTILQISKYFYLKGGSDKVFLDTIDLLKEYGETVYCLCLKSPKNRNNSYEEECYFVDYPELSTVGFWQKVKNSMTFFYNRDAKKKIEKLILDKKPDVAHIHMLFNGISVSILPVLKKYRIPIVMTLHDYRLLCPSYILLNGRGEVCERCRNGLFFQCITNRCSRRGWIVDGMLFLEMYFRNFFYSPIKYVDQFVFVSRFSFQKHISFHSKYEKKGTLLYNFVRRRVGGVVIDKKQSERYLLYYGRLSYEKGIHTLIEAVKSLDISLKIVGDGDVLDFSSSVLPSNVELCGFKSGESLLEIIRGAYFVVVPSEWYETFGLTALEPQAEGVPIIGARIGAIPELIEDGRNGFLFEAGNSNDLRQTIKRAMKLPAEEYEKMSSKANERSMVFSNRKNAYRDLMGVYARVQDKYSIY